MTEGEQAYQANLAAARERLAKIEAAMTQPTQPVAPTPITPATPPPPAPAPAATPAPPPTVAAPAGFSLSNLKNPEPGTAAPASMPQPAPTPPATPTSDVAAIIAAHKSVSPLSDAAQPATAPTMPAPALSTAMKPPEHLEPVKTPKPPRSMPSRLKPLISAVIVFFLVLGAFKAPVFYYQIKYLLGNQNNSQNATPANTQITTTPTLTIPKINVSAPIIFEPSIQEARVQKALESGVVHYGNTAKPGQPGNTVMFGHSSNDWDKPGNFKFIFVLLDKLAIGDSFTIDYEGTRYEYQIYNRQIILATDVHVVQPTSVPTATLITCWPIGTSQKRLIVQGKQVSPEPKANATIATTTNKQTSSVLPGTDSNSGLIGTVTTWIENIQSALRGDPIQVNDK